jgi:hypothetical protein
VRERAHTAKRGADDAPDLHLRDAVALRDLGLGAVFLEASQHLALAQTQVREPAVQGGALLCHDEAVVGRSDGVAERLAGVVSAARGSATDVVRYAVDASSASSTCSWSTLSAEASSGTVGARCRAAESSAVLRATRRASSWRRVGPGRSRCGRGSSA